MGMVFRRKLYPRGGSYETTLPMQLLFSLNPKERHEVLFEYDAEKKRWYVDFQRVKDCDVKHPKKGRKTQK